ncbi:MAG TPA: hypothetical protein PLW92_11340 [Chitinophagales bacterium]|nr:hypothetical protein [Chitinophagales bacterium]
MKKLTDLEEQLKQEKTNFNKNTKNGKEQQQSLSKQLDTIGQAKTHTTTDTGRNSSIKKNNESSKSSEREKGGGNIERPKLED